MKQLSIEGGQINAVVSSGVGCAPGVAAAIVQQDQDIVVDKGVSVGASFSSDNHIDAICDPRTKRCGAKDNAASSSTAAVAALYYNLG